MSRKILIFSYWFPPNNAIGASRASAMANFFHRRGWEVTVIGANSAAVPTDFAVDLEGIEIHRVADTARTKAMNIRLGRNLLARVSSALLRYVAFPDVFQSTTAKMGALALKFIAGGREFDVVLSTSLPFSQHVQAARVAKAAGAMLVLDNRDTWACNDYRRRLPFSDALERNLEARTFAPADLITAISESMARYYRQSYPTISDKVLAVRNGVDAAQSGASPPERSGDDRIRVVYTGILYGEKRDVRPVLDAARAIDQQIAFDFYGAEAGSVAKLQREYPDIEITSHGRVARQEAHAAQRSASLLLVALGTDEAEKSFLPGKFFEYIGTGRPILVLADPDFEISQLVNEFRIGLATRDRAKIMQFLQEIAQGGVASRMEVPVPLTREFQLEKLEARIVAKLALGSGGCAIA